MENTIGLQRYSVIESVIPREFLLLQGRGCRWRKCTFCDYHNDISGDPYEINKAVLDRVTGVYGTLDIINSGSAMELDSQTIGHILGLSGKAVYKKLFVHIAQRPQQICHNTTINKGCQNI